MVGLHKSIKIIGSITVVLLVSRGGVPLACNNVTVGV